MVGLLPFNDDMWPCSSNPPALAESTGCHLASRCSGSTVLTRVEAERRLPPDVKHTMHRM